MKSVRPFSAIIAAAITLQAYATSPTPPASFFPDNAFASKYDNGSFEREWYGRALKALDEPTMRVSAAAGDSYRFLWLRSFHRPVAIRLVALENGAARVRYKMSDGAGGYDPGRIIIDKSLTIDAKKFAKIKSLFDDAKICEPFESDVLGLDGAQWIFETNVGGEYCVAVEWGGYRPGFQELGRALLDLVGWREKKNDPLY